MLNIWKKRFVDVSPDELRKTITDYEQLDNDDIKEVVLEEIRNFNLTNESL